jgi:hypothetical protein
MSGGGGGGGGYDEVARRALAKLSAQSNSLYPYELVKVGVHGTAAADAAATSRARAAPAHVRACAAAS